MSVAGLGPLAPGRPRLGSVLMLYAVRLRKRWVAELMAVLGIASGVALLYAASVASTSLSAPVRSLNEGLVGHSQLQLVSRGSVGMPERDYQRVIGLPGVRRAAPVLEVPGNLVGPHGQTGVILFGADPRIVRLHGNLLEGFTSADAAQQEALVIPAPVAKAIGLKFGQDVRLQLAGRTLTVPAAVAGREQIGSLVDTSIALLPLAYLQRLAGAEQQVTRILVEAAPGKVDDVRRGMRQVAAGGLDVRPADYESHLFDNAAKPTDQATLAFSALSALVGFLFAACALLVTAGDRRKMAVQQRSMGVRPLARMVTLMVDALVVGVLGVLLGLLAGEVLSREGFSSDVSFLSGAFPVGDRRIVTWQSIAIAGVGGLVAATVGVLAPLREIVIGSLPRGLRRAGRDRPGNAAGGDPRPFAGSLPLAGLTCLVAAVAITLFAPGAVIVGLVLLGLALAFVLPATLTATIAGLAWWNRHAKRSSNAAELALQHLTTRRWRPRALAITATGAIAVFGATALQGARANLQGGLDDLTTGLTETTEVWAAPAGAGSAIGIARFPPTAAARLAQLPPISSVRLYRAGLLDLAGQRAWIIGQPVDVTDPIPPHQVLEGNAALAAREIRRGGWTSVSKALARGLDVRVGQAFTLNTPHPVRLRVAAITTNLGWSAGALVLNAVDFARAWGGKDIAAYQFQLRPGVPATVGAAQIAAALGPRSPLRVETGHQRGDRQRAITRAGLARLREITTVTLIAAILAMGAAMTGLLWQHRPVVSRLKAHGPRTSMMWRMLLIETGVLFGAGAVAGGIFGLLGQVLGTKGVEVVTGFPAVEQLRPDVAGATIALVVGASLLVVAVPGYLVARVRPSWRG